MIWLTISLFALFGNPIDVFVFIITPPDAVEDICFMLCFAIGVFTFLIVPLCYTPTRNEALPSSFLYFLSKATLERDLPRTYYGTETGILYKHGFNGLLSR